MTRLLDWSIVILAALAGVAVGVTGAKYDNGNDHNRDRGTRQRWEGPDAHNHNQQRLSDSRKAIRLPERDAIRVPDRVRDKEGIGTRAELGSRTTHTALWKAICTVESGNDPNAIGDGGLAVGIAQIWPITVRDCNRIIGRDRFQLADRLDPAKSYEMFCVYANHYGKGKSDEWIARAWNGSPRWERKPAAVKARTAAYWAKVQRELNR